MHFLLRQIMTARRTICITVFVICQANLYVAQPTWVEIPQDVQTEKGRDIVLPCKLENLSPSIVPFWNWQPRDGGAEVRLSDGTQSDEDWIEIVTVTGSYQLKIKAIDYDKEGSYSCNVLNADPQSESALVGVWTPVTMVTLDGGSDQTVEVPWPGQSVSVTRTCVVSKVKPAVDITWVYHITSDAGTNIVGELPYDFESGSLPDDNIPVGVDNDIEVKRTVTDNGDGTSNVESKLTVMYTSADNTTGKAEANLKIDVACKAKQDGYVEKNKQMESDPVTTHVKALDPPVVGSIVILDWSKHLVTLECNETTNSTHITYLWQSYGDEVTQRGNTRIWQVEDTDKDRKVNVSCTASSAIGSDTLQVELSPSSSSTGSSGCDTGCIIGVSVAAGIIAIVVIALLVWVFFIR